MFLLFLRYSILCSDQSNINCTNIPSCRAPSNGFSKYSVKSLIMNATALYKYSCLFRAFQDILVLKLLCINWNIKKISFSCAGHLQGYFVQSIFKFS